MALKLRKIDELVIKAKKHKKLPAVIKRCVMSIVAKNKAGAFTPRDNKDLYTSALEVCLSSFQNAGMLKGNTVGLTGKGKDRNEIALGKKDTPQKLSAFDKFAKKMSKVEPETKKPEKKKPAKKAKAPTKAPAKAPEKKPAKRAEPKVTPKKKAPAKKSQPVKAPRKTKRKKRFQGWDI